MCRPEQDRTIAPREFGPWEGTQGQMLLTRTHRFQAWSPEGNTNLPRLQIRKDSVV